MSTRNSLVARGYDRTMAGEPFTQLGQVGSGQGWVTTRLHVCITFVPWGPAFVGLYASVEHTKTVLRLTWLTVYGQGSSMTAAPWPAGHRSAESSSPAGTGRLSMVHQPIARTLSRAVAACSVARACGSGADHSSAGQSLSEAVVNGGLDQPPRCTKDFPVTLPGQAGYPFEATSG